MSEVPVQVIVAAFSNTAEAGQMLADLKQGRKDGLIGIIDAAVVVKDENGKLKIKDTKRRSRSRRGLITGGVVGGLLGLLAGPVALAALGGGALGMLAGRLSTHPAKVTMQSLGDALPPNSSAIVAVIEHTWVAKVEDAMMEAGATVLRAALAADIAAQLEAEGNVIYTAIQDGESTTAARIAESTEGVQVSAVGIDAEGVYIADAMLTDEEAAEEADVIEGETVNDAGDKPAS